MTGGTTKTCGFKPRDSLQTVIIKVVVIRVMTLISAADETNHKERSKVKGNLYHIFTSFQKYIFKAIQFNRFCFLNEGFFIQNGSSLLGLRVLTIC